MPTGEDVAESITIRKRRRRGRLSVRVIDNVDEEALTATAEKWAMLGGDDLEDLEEEKTAHLRRAIMNRLRAEAPEVFNPGTKATVQIDSDRDIDRLV
jgi:hypothetical protein